MKKSFSAFLYGGDYNPNQWPREVWDEDLRLFDLAHINSASINIFSWAKIQPSEDVFDFSELDELIELLSSKGIQIVLATATAALPAWMFRKYPEVGRVDYEGRRHKFGQRHNACPSSPAYRRLSAQIAEKLAERYGRHPNVVCWHVNNEYGGACYCELCEQNFRLWLKDKYGSVEALNAAWNLEFWGHLVWDFDEVVAHNALSEGIGQDRTAFSGHAVDYMRFNSDNILGNFTAERDAIRKHDPHTPITTNLMGTFKPLDYFKWAKEMDIVSWDNYPAYNTPWSFVAMRHDLMRGLKRQPFMLMEQTPSQQNWQPYNSLKRPGQMRAQSYQSVAHGADTVQFFQLRRSKGGCEKFHGAVIAHVGTEHTRVFREVSQLGKELAAIGSGLLGADSPAKVGLIFDWDNFWALEYSSGPSVDLKYVDQIHQYYRYFHQHNIPVDMIATDGDFSPYDLVVAPVLYMVKPGVAEALERFVAGGGTLVTGFMSGLTDETDNVHLGGYPGPLRKLAGIWAEEIDALAPGQQNSLRFQDGQQGSCSLLCDILHLEGAEALAYYTSDFYADSPVVTRNRFGKGQVYYIGSQLDEQALSKALSMAQADARVQPLVGEKTALEVCRRRQGDTSYYFIMNFSGKSQPLPGRFQGQTDILTGRALAADAMLAPYDVHIVVLEESL